MAHFARGALGAFAAMVTVVTLIFFFGENCIPKTLIASVTIVLIKAKPFVVRFIFFFCGKILIGFSCTIVLLIVIVTGATSSMIMKTSGRNMV